jgi:hypothetical protein
MDESFIQSNESQSVKVDKVIDTTKTERGKITITEIEFYPPPNGSDTVNHIPATNVGGMDLPIIGNIKEAAIKSIKQTAIELNAEQKGQSNESSETKGNQEQVILANNKQSSQESIAPTPDPYRWRYIFGIFAILAVGLLYRKRIPVLNWIKKILSNIRRIF